MLQTSKRYSATYKNKNGVKFCCMKMDLLLSFQAKKTKCKLNFLAQKVHSQLTLNSLGFKMIGNLQSYTKAVKTLSNVLAPYCLLASCHGWARASLK